MLTQIIRPRPFVKWKFQCENREEKKLKQNAAKDALLFVFAVYNKALLDQGIKPIKFTFTGKFVRSKPGSKIFKFQPIVRRSTQTDPTPTTPKEPPPPSPQPPL